ncbi:MAG: 3-dehydroquinate synthase [bacterium]
MAKPAAGPAAVMLMYRIPVQVGGGRDYTISIGMGLSALLPREIKAISRSCRVFVVTTRRVAEHHLGKWLEGMEKRGVEVGVLFMPVGERAKNLGIWSRLLREIAADDDERDVVVAAFGGGVVGDVAGFVAATYRRGVPYVQVPTTLVGFVDSSVGGKTGVDLPEGKNLVGAFHQPRAVIIDLDFLDTLPAREFRAGCAEVIKCGAALDGGLFRYLEEKHEEIRRRERAAVAYIVKRCCELKAMVVGRDERDELGIRAKLNFGHTFAHAFEAAGGYGRYRHGECVGVGMLCAGEISMELGMLSRNDFSRVEETVRRAGLPRRLEKLDTGDVMDFMRRDKKFRGGRSRFVLLRGIGRSVVMEGVPEALVRTAVRRRLRP